MNPVKLEDVSEECEKIIAKHPTGPYFDINDTCFDEDCHSDQCRIGMEEWSQPCIRVDAEKAEQRRNRLLFLPLLKDCAQHPARANGLHTLEGLAQDSCIYDTKYLRRLLLSAPRPPSSSHRVIIVWERAYSDLVRGPNRVVLPLPHRRFQETVQMRGLHFVLGLRKDRMRIELPFRISCAWGGIAVIWLCLVLWRGGGGDWGTALAFAQLVAASISIVATA